MQELRLRNIASSRLDLHCRDVDTDHVEAYGHEMSGDRYARTTPDVEHTVPRLQLSDEAIEIRQIMPMVPARFQVRRDDLVVSPPNELVPLWMMSQS